MLVLVKLRQKNLIFISAWKEINYCNFHESVEERLSMISNYNQCDISYILLLIINNVLKTQPQITGRDNFRLRENYNYLNHSDLIQEKFHKIQDLNLL